MDGLSAEGETLSGSRFDLVVIGGGVTGACVALEGSRRGLSTALFEARDFGGHTSWSSMRILHGGLRYLQTADLPRFFTSVADRRWFMRTFPGLTTPQPFLMPLYGRGLRRPSIMRAALAMNDMLSRHRNRGLDPGLHIGGGGVLGRDATRRAFPGVDERGLRGAARWVDGRMAPPQRLLMEILRWAAENGARAVAHTPVLGLAPTAGGDVEVSFRSALDGGQGSVRAGRVAVCVGPEREVLRGLLGELPEGAPAPAVNFNVVLRRPLPSSSGLALDPPGHPTIFLCPMGNLTMAGTVHAKGTCQASPTVGSDEVARFLAVVRSVLPGWSVGMEDVVRILSGPLPSTQEDEMRFGARPWVLEPSGPLAESTRVVVAVKYTTAPSLARSVVDTLAPDSSPPPASSPRRTLAVPDAASFLDLTRSDPARAAALLAALWAEGARDLDDVLLRRTDWGLDPQVGAEIAQVVGDVPGLPSGPTATR